MEWVKTFTKALQGGVSSLAGLLSAQLVAHQELILDWVTTAVAAAVAGIIAGVANWLKHREA